MKSSSNSFPFFFIFAASWWHSRVKASNKHTFLNESNVFLYSTWLVFVNLLQLQCPRPLKWISARDDASYAFVRLYIIDILLRQIRYKQSAIAGDWSAIVSGKCVMSGAICVPPTEHHTITVLSRRTVKGEGVTKIDLHYNVSWVNKGTNNWQEMIKGLLHEFLIQIFYLNDSVGTFITDTKPWEPTCTALQKQNHRKFFSLVFFF